VFFVDYKTKILTLINGDYCSMYRNFGMRIEIIREKDYIKNNN